mgnify:CR=1 FL=1
MRKYNLLKSGVLILLLSGLLMMINGCEKNPSDLGLNYINSGDTLGSKILDSQVDTILQVSSGFLKYLNTYSSQYFLVGKYQGYESKTLLKFNDITASYDSCTVLSATLNFRYGNYFFKDSLGQTSFNVYALTDTVGLSTVNFGTFNQSVIGSNVLATYSGNPVDTSQITIPFDNETAKQWIWKAANSNHSFSNNGVAISPNANSNTIKGFFTSRNADSLKPYIKAVVSLNNEIDTLIFNSSETVTLTNSGSITLPADRIFVQAGVAYRSKFSFDLSKLGGKVSINDATIDLYLDKTQSFTKMAEKRIILAEITDTANMTTGIEYLGSIADSQKYSFRITPTVQKWNLGTLTNYGFLIYYVYDYQGLDQFYLYGTNYNNLSLRPRIKIRYTPRN